MQTLRTGRRIVSLPDPNNPGPSEDRLQYLADTASDLRWGCVGLGRRLGEGRVWAPSYIM